MDPVLLSLGAIGASLGTSYFETSTLHLDTQQIWAEWATWFALFASCKLRTHLSTHSDKQYDDKESQAVPQYTRLASDHHAWILASLLVASQIIVLRSPASTVHWALPLTTLVIFSVGLLWHQRSVGCDLESRPSSRTSSPTRVSHSISGASDRVFNTVVFVGLCLVSAYAMSMQIETLPYKSILTAAIPFIILTSMVYVLMARLAVAPGPVAHTSNSFFRILETIEPIALRAFALCTLYLAFSSVPFPSLRFLVLVFTFLRVGQVFASLYLCFSNAPMAPILLLTTSMNLFQSSTASTYTESGTCLLVAIAALVQTISILPKSGINRTWLFVVLLLPLASVLHSTTMQDSIRPSSHLTSVHPIQSLVQAGHSTFEHMQTQQSKTLEEAVAEYRRRYGRSPPPGFDQWYRVAQEKSFLLVDEFDTVMESLEPFWGLSPSVLRSRVHSIKEAPEMTEFRIHNGEVENSGDHYHAAYLKMWLDSATWGSILPNVSFMISTLDEPRVVAPHDTLELAMQNVHSLQHQRTRTGRPDLSLLQKSHSKATDVKWLSIGEQDAWEGMMSSCQISSPARNEATGSDLDNLSKLKFVDNVTQSLDVCGSPDRLGGHGFLASPQSLMITHSLVPVFSQCKPSVFNDVLYPSPYYQMQIQSGDYKEEDDTVFEQKLDRLYWAGTATGGHSTADNWMKLHRQRLVLAATETSQALVSLMQRGLGGVWQLRKTSWSEVAHLFYLRITALAQCSEEACETMKQHFTSPPEAKEAALGSKYALDMDGNTFSGRYYRLLKSNVAVLKHTVFKEWHDGRLVPWVHYIPLSAEAEELGEIMRFLVEDEEGRAIGQSIASQGRDWARKTLRKEDLEVAFVRVLMEYARIMSDDRDTMGYEARK